MPDAVAGADLFALPEFTRSLRGFASVGSLGSPDHDRVFAPLLAARRAAARVATVEGRLAAFDAARLRRELGESIDAMCAARAPKPGAERRALQARLTELAEPALDALDVMERAAATVRVATGTERAELWPIWIRAVQALFDHTDRFWMAVQESLRPVRSGRRARSARLALLLAVLGAGAPVGVHAQHLPIRISGVPAESLLKRGFDVAGVERNAVIVVATPAQRARLDALGWRGTVVLPRGASPQRAISAQVVTPTTVYRSFDDPVRGVRVFIDSLARNNTRISVDTLGLSYEGRPMLAVKVGARDDSPSRPNVLFMATYHAREWAATEVALRLLLYLANSSGDARVDSLLQTRDIWIMPVANPDGYQYTFSSDRLWRKTRSPQAGGNFGVDMNRNHRQNWGLDDDGSSPDPSSDIYRGPSPASEIEVRNIEKFHAAHPPVATVTYHTYAGLVMYAPSATYGPLPADLPVYRTLAGTNVRSAVIDRLPGSQRTFDSPSSAWMLYTTNGEYTDWASVQYGTIAFTQEMTSGYTGGDYYGFEFPDDEATLQGLFNDNLPFALDVIESARDPFGYVSPTTFFRSDRVVLESVSPDVRVTVPAAAATTAKVTAPGAVGFHVDSGAGGHYTRRLVTSTVNRPPTISVSAAGQTANFAVLAINGAERTETGWTPTQPFAPDSTSSVAGKYSWYSPAGGTLKSPVIAVPAAADTVSLVFWTKYSGSGFTQEPSATVLMSADAGSTFQPVLRLEGYAPTWYPENVTIGGVKGKQLVFQFTSNAMPWSLDEIAVVSHGAVTTAPVTGAVALVPSENPVRHGAVYFAWPFTTPTGDIQAYDFSGRLVWKSPVTLGGNVKWDLKAAALPNGVYVVVARSGGQTMRLKLYVVRDGT